MNSDTIFLIYFNSILLLSKSSYGDTHVHSMSRSLLFHEVRNRTTTKAPRPFSCDDYETCADCEMFGLGRRCNWKEGVCELGSRRDSKHNHCFDIHQVNPSSVRVGDRFHIVIARYFINKTVDELEVRVGSKECQDLAIGQKGLIITCTANNEPGEQPLFVEITRRNASSAITAIGSVTVIKNGDDDSGFTQFVFIAIAIVIVILLGLFSFVIYWFLRYTTLSSESFRSAEGIRIMMPLPFRRRFDTNKRNLSKYSVQKTDSLHVPEPRNVSAISEQFKQTFDQDSTRSGYDGYG